MDSKISSAKPQVLTRDKLHLVQFEQAVGPAYYACIAGYRLAKLDVGLSSNCDHIVYRYELPFGKQKVLKAESLTEAMFKLANILEGQALEISMELDRKNKQDADQI